MDRPIRLLKFSAIRGFDKFHTNWNNLGNMNLFHFRISIIFDAVGEDRASLCKNTILARTCEDEMLTDDVDR